MIVGMQRCAGGAPVAVGLLDRRRMRPMTRVTDEIATLAISTAAGPGTVDDPAWARLAGMRIAPLGSIEGWTHGDRH